MEEEPQIQLSSSQVINNEEEEVGGDDAEFYEKIEAPKFVDFTRPDRPRPDDRYWFCLRVGCDQKHEEEMDPEAISKNFFLRVMAARSPNVRFQKALNRKASGMNEQCPLSAPAKPSKSRVSRLAVISSISHKKIDAKEKVKPLSKLTSTPKAKAKQVAAKYLTTPRNKKCLPNQNSFRSVQNPKPSSIAVPKNRIVAKALVFHSPKKAITIKTSSELRTPLTKICEGMKRLEITSQRKRMLGYVNKSSKDIRRNPNKPLPVDPSRSKLSTCKDKSKAKELLKPPNCKDRDTKSSRRVKRKSKGNLDKPCNSMPKEAVKNDLSDMELDMKSREGSVLGSSRITEGNVYEERLVTEKTSGSFESSNSTQEEAIPCLEVEASTENSDKALSDASGSKMNSLSNSEEGCLEENDFSEGIVQEKKTKSQSLGVGHEVEDMDSDDKENALGTDGNRDVDSNKNQSAREVLGKQETNKITKKVARALDKNLKEGLAVTATGGAQGVKYKKPKTTNPKPFRLRTDERGILKETKLERRIQSLVPQKETETVSILPGGILQKRPGNDDNQKSRKSGLTTLEGQVRQKTATIITLKKHSNSIQQKPKSIPSRFMCQKSEYSLRKPKSSSLQGQNIRPKRVASTKQLNVIKETSSTASRSEEDVGEPSQSDSRVANKAVISGKRRPATIPKEPNFQCVHVPKSCARKVA
ncbi:hypothetical protein LOK49_LG12G00607 [Camellia lanceoleosa]|uniref:Uncharacterized protein n=1 Tax=Camellia lanceoleosa TaxID=1840588 RepID=A0ACC0FRG7_9ERIC|nr:hypothetical protein LOK49_LG12G00607 [Camellia lanceoleosa]